MPHSTIQQHIQHTQLIVPHSRKPHVHHEGFIRTSLLSLSPEELQNRTNEAKSQNLMLSVRPERFKLPLGSNSSVRVILENKNNFTIKFSVDATSPTSLTVEPKDGCIAPGHEAHVIVARSKRMFLTQVEEHLVFQVKSCHDCNYVSNKEHKRCKKTKAADSLPTHDTRKRCHRHRHKLHGDSKKYKAHKERTTTHQDSAFHEDEHSNRYGESSQSGVHFVDGDESNERQKNVAMASEMQNMGQEKNEDVWSGGFPSIGGGQSFANDDLSNWRRSTQNVSTGPKFRDDIDQNNGHQGNSSAGPKFDEDDVKNGSTHTLTSKGPKVRRDTYLVLENYSGPKFHEEEGSTKSNNTLISTTGSKFKDVVASNVGNFRDSHFVDGGYSNQRYGSSFMNAHPRLPEEDRSMKAPDAGPRFTDIEDSNWAFMKSSIHHGGLGKYKVEEPWKGFDDGRPMGPIRHDFGVVPPEAKFADDNRPENFNFSSHQSQHYSQRNPAVPGFGFQDQTNPWRRVAQHYKGDSESEEDFECSHQEDDSRSCSCEDCTEQRDRSDENQPPDGVFRRIMRKMSSIFGGESDAKAVQKNPVAEEELPCDCSFCTRQSRNRRALKIKIKDKRDGNRRFDEVSYETRRNALMYALLISLIVVVFVSFWDDSVFQPFFAYFRPAEPTLWEKYVRFYYQ